MCDRATSKPPTSLHQYLDWEVRQHAKADPRVKVLTRLPGVGPFTALVHLGRDR
jgi:hypothetical protein